MEKLDFFFLCSQFENYRNLRVQEMLRWERWLCRSVPTGSPGLICFHASCCKTTSWDKPSQVLPATKKERRKAQCLWALGLQGSHRSIHSHFTLMLRLASALLDLRFDIGTTRQSMTSRARDFRTFFIGGRCWGQNTNKRNKHRWEKNLFLLQGHPKLRKSWLIYRCSPSTKPPRLCLVLTIVLRRRSGGVAWTTTMSMPASLRMTSLMSSSRFGVWGWEGKAGSEGKLKNKEVAVSGASERRSPEAAGGRTFPWHFWTALASAGLCSAPTCG